MHTTAREKRHTRDPIGSTRRWCTSCGRLRTRRIRWKGDLLPVAVLFLKQPPAAEALQSGRAPLRPPAPDPTSEATPSSNMAPHMQGRQAKVQEGPSGGALPPLPPLKKKGPCPPVRNPP